MTIYSPDSFSKHLKGYGIEIVDKIECNKDKTSEHIIDEQLEAINEFHIAASNYNGMEVNRFENRTGKFIEKNKINYKKVKKQLNAVKEKKEKNNFEKNLIGRAENYLSRAEKSIKTIESCDYYNIIKRSMEKNEKCLGNTYFDNILKNKEIEIVSLKNVNINIVEMDIYYLIYKLKKKRINLDYCDIINKYCEKEKLKNNSEKLIKALVSYPYEYFRLCLNYENYMGESTERHLISKLMKIDEKEGESLI